MQQSTKKEKNEIIYKEYENFKLVVKKINLKGLNIEHSSIFLWFE